MARINLTLDQNEILSLLAGDTGGAFAALLQKSLNAVLLAESDEQLGAARYERAEARTDVRNGTRERPLATRVGTIELTVPRHRNAPFRTLVFDNYSRSEAALVTTMAEMVVSGVSTAKVGRVMETICGKSFSKQCVSEACRDLDAIVGEFLARPIEGDHPFLMADATYIKCREGHRVVAKALLVAIGFTPDGRKEVLGFEVADAETTESWTRFLAGLRRRGLSGVRLATTDAHEGLVAALQSVFPEVPWQRCQAHFARNVVDAAPKRLRVGLRGELAEMFNAKTMAEARRRRDEIAADYAGAAPRAVERLDAGFDDAMTVMELPEALRRVVRTSNHLERLNGEVKRRSSVVKVFPNADSIARLIGAVLIEEGERWAAGRRLFYSPAVKELQGVVPRLEVIAREQRQLRLAA